MLKDIFSITKYPLLFLAICWSIFYFDTHFDLDLFRYGVSPRKVNGLIGILTSPFLHADFNHIANNSLPILILGSMIFYFYKSIAWQSIMWVYVISGLWLWIGGRNSDVTPTFHFGASTLIYAFSTFLFFSGVFRKHKPLMVVSAMVVFLYGSITHGIFPFDEAVSWEGHLFGALSGILIAYQYRKEGPQKPIILWPENEIDLERLYNESLQNDIIQDNSVIEQLENQPPLSLDPFNVVYHYKPNDEPKPKL